MKTEAMDFTTIRYEVEDRVATITLDRPDQLNALSPAMVTELQFSRADVAPFQPGGLSARATPEWIQITRSDAADYEKDLELFKTSLEYVKTGRK